MSALLVLLRRRLGGLGGGVPLALLQGVLGSLGMGLVLAGWLVLTPAVPDVLRLAVGALLGVAAYAAVMAALRVPELRSALTALQRRLGKK